MIREGSVRLAPARALTRIQEPSDNAWTFRLKCGAPQVQNDSNEKQRYRDDPLIAEIFDVTRSVYKVTADGAVKLTARGIVPPAGGA